VACPAPPWYLVYSSLPALHPLVLGLLLASTWPCLSDHACWFGFWCGVVVMNLPWCSAHEQGRLVQMVLVLWSLTVMIKWWCGVVLCVCLCLMNMAGKFWMSCPISRACPLVVVSTTHSWHPVCELLDLLLVTCWW
jgi:hypothetical protein